MKTIAVLLSTYNGEKYLSCQLNSIINQISNNLEFYIIIRDDGSKDKTIEIIKKYISKNERIELIEGKNIGFVGSFFELIYYAKNHLIKFDYIALADQDDKWDNIKIFAAINYLEETNITNNIPLLYQSRSRTVNQNLEFLGIPKIIFRPLTIYNTIIQTCCAGHTYVFNRSLLMKVHNNLNYSKIYAHDSYLTILASVYGKILYDKNAYTDYRQHNKNQFGTSNKSFILWIISRLKKIFNGHSKIYGAQIEYLFNLLKNDLKKDVYEELYNFCESNSNIFKRIVYIINTKFYRQTFWENFLFKMLYIFGGYNYKKRNFSNKDIQ